MISSRYVGAEWQRTSCDRCSAFGVLALVKVNSDGSVEGRQYPSLCDSCHGTPPLRDALEDDAAAHWGLVRRTGI